VGEDVGYNAEKGVRTSSRIDPILRKNPSIFKNSSGDWTADNDEAEKDSDGNPVKFGKKLSELNFGNVTPDFVRFNPKEKKSLRTMYEDIRVDDVLPGGVSIEYAEQTVVLSLPALRRLRFPVDGKEPKETPERNAAARVVLAALALAAVVHQHEQGYDLRSRCLLIPQSDPVFELIAANGIVEKRTLKPDKADMLLTNALQAAQALELPWQTEPVRLNPEEKLVKLVRASRQSTEGE
jgi:CRISPR-associated protein Csb1